MDMMPNDYRRYLSMLGHLRRLGWATGGLLLATSLGFGGMSYSISRDKTVLDSLQQRRVATAAQRQQLERLTAEQTELDKDIRALERLRQGLASEALFVAVDHAVIGTGVWFKRWTFFRDGQQQSRPQEVHTGYMVVVPQGQGRTPNQRWKETTHMEISGQALDHAGLSRFVQRLLKQKIVSNVLVLDTQSAVINGVDVVEFSVAVILGGEGARV